MANKTDKLFYFDVKFLKNGVFRAIFVDNLKIVLFFEAVRSDFKRIYPMIELILGVLGWPYQ